MCFYLLSNANLSTTYPKRIKYASWKQICKNHAEEQGNKSIVTH